VRLAILGSPVQHSLSPAMHRAALAHIGEDGDYETREVGIDGLYAGIADLRQGVLVGANVTMPHKVTAHDLCDELTSQAHAVKAVNTLSMRRGKLIGDNTDVRGIRFAWELRQFEAADPVIILGAGGASAAAQVALSDMELYVVARRPAIARVTSERIGSTAAIVKWGDPVPSGIVVNATSLGMHGEMLPEFLLDSAVGLFDMPYGDSPTRSVQAARDRGLPVADGLDMLVGQAVGSFATWTGIYLDAAIFRTAAEAELARRAL